MCSAISSDADPNYRDDGSPVSIRLDLAHTTLWHEPTAMGRMYRNSMLTSLLRIVQTADSDACLYGSSGVLLYYQPFVAPDRSN